MSRCDLCPCLVRDRMPIGVTDVVALLGIAAVELRDPMILAFQNDGQIALFENHIHPNIGRAFIPSSLQMRIRMCSRPQEAPMLPPARTQVPSTAGVGLSRYSVDNAVDA